MNILLEQLTSLRLYGMVQAAQDLLAMRAPPNLTTTLKQLIEAETVERRVRQLLIKCGLPNSLSTGILQPLIMRYRPLSLRKWNSFVQVNLPRMRIILFLWVALELVKLILPLH